MGRLARHSEINDVRDALISFTHVLKDVRFPFDTSLSQQGRSYTRHCLAQAYEYLFHQFSGSNDPLVVAVCGATGSGKSTIVNAIARENVVRACAVRPTTRTPALIYNPYLSTALTDDEKSVFRTRIHATQIACTSMPTSYVLIDCPDFTFQKKSRSSDAADSVSILDRIDMCVYVTSAARYSDEAVWAQIHALMKRNMPIAILINRVPRNARADIREDFEKKMYACSYTRIPIFLIGENAQAHDLHMPVSAGAVEGVREWIETWCSSSGRGLQTARNSFRAALQAVTRDAQCVVDAYEQQVEVQINAEKVFNDAYSNALNHLKARLTNRGILNEECNELWISIVESFATNRRHTSTRRQGVHITRLIKIKHAQQHAKACMIDASARTSLKQLWVSEALTMLNSVICGWNSLNETQVLCADYAHKEHSLSEQTRLLGLQADKELDLWENTLYATVNSYAGKNRQRSRMFRRLGKHVVEAACIVCLNSDPSISAQEPSDQKNHARRAYRMAYRTLRGVCGDEDTRALLANLRKELIIRTYEFIHTCSDPFRKRLINSGVDADLCANLRAKYQCVRTTVESAL